MSLPFFWPAFGFILGILAWLKLSAHESWIWGALYLQLPLLWFSRGRKFFLPLLHMDELLHYHYAYSLRCPSYIQARGDADWR